MTSKPEPLRCLLYVSTARRAMSKSDLDDILHVARSENAKNRITGVLAYCGEQFLQVIEGPPEKVEETLGRIREDSRHFHLTVMLDEIVSERFFDDWAMGYGSLEDDQFRSCAAARGVLTGRGSDTIEMIRNLFSVFRQGLA